jgi:hypothetical protein
MLKAKSFILIFLFFFSFYSYSQQIKVRGKVFDKTGQPINNVPVQLKNKDNRIIIFNNTTINGEFSLSFSDTLERIGLFLEINYLGYKSVRIALAAKLLEYNIVLEDKIIELAEVKVSKKPFINAKGDTLSYNVSSFSQAQDRSIGDVLKRMPGIEIAENGQISYNGKAISNMYIGDDDLLDGKYVLGTRTIPKNIIQSVDVMQNHQPIKALKDKKSSDDVALNLVIKDDANLTLSGEAMVGLGLPGQYDLALNTILLNKKIKMLNVMQANNIGLDYRDDLQQLGNSGLLSSTGNNRPVSLLSARTVGNPNIPRKNYYLNNSGILNANNLYNFKSGLQIKSNVQAFIDKNHFNYFSLTNYYLNNDTVKYIELQESVNKPIGLSGTFKAMVNKEKYYINNDLKIDLSREKNQSNMTLNDLRFNQKLRNTAHDLSNYFRFMPSLANSNIIDLSWYINYYNNPQDLNIDQGLNKEILNGGVPFMGIEQGLFTETLFSNASLSYRIPKYKIRQNYLMSVINEDQRLNSSLFVIQNDNQILPYLKDKGNDVTWKRNRISFNAFYELKKNKWEVILSVPFIMQRIKYVDHLSNLNENKSSFFINPSTRLKFFTASEDYFQFNYNHNNVVGNITDIYKGAILTDYRTLQSNTSQLQEQALSGLGLFYNFQRSVSMLFINVGINYSKIKSSTIQSSLINNDIEQTILLPFDNQISSYNTKLGISKYIFGLRTTASLKLSWSKAQFNQFFNGQILPVENVGFTTNINLESKLFNKLGIGYRAVISHTENSSSNFRRRIMQYNQNISLSHSPLNKMQITLNARNMYGIQKGTQDLNYVFVDGNIRYKLVKLKSDLEIQLNNITNVKKYEIFNLSNNKSSYNKYDIRGYTVMLKTTFYL